MNSIKQSLRKLFILKKIDSFVFILRVDQVRLGSPCPIEDGILAFGRRRLVQKSRAQQQGAGQQCGKTDRVEAVQHSPIRPDCSIAHGPQITRQWVQGRTADHAGYQRRRNYRQPTAEPFAPSHQTGGVGGREADGRVGQRQGVQISVLQR